MKAIASYRFGPFSTESNRGYESASEISPIAPNSYRARRAPSLYAVQFVADAPRSLRQDALSMTIAHGGDRLLAKALCYTEADLVGYAPNRRRPPAEIQFHMPGFSPPNSTWTVSAQPPRPSVPVETAYDRETLEVLNAYRQRLGETPVTYDGGLALAAIAHAQYLAKNGYSAPSFHDEQAGHPGYSGSTPWARDMAFGWPSSLSGEVGIEWSQAMPPAVVVESLIDTVYHRLDLLSDNLYNEGQGASVGATGAVVMDLGYGYVSGLPHAVVYPYPGQIGVPIGWTDLESPNPMPGGFGHSFGYPVTVDLPTVASLKDASLALSTAGLTVGSWVDAPGRGDTDANQAGLVPNLWLNPDTVYTVHFSARAVYQSGAVRPIRLRWQFATGGAALSVSATVAQGKAVVAVAQSGSGTAVANEPVVLERGSQRVRAATTNANGSVTFALSGPGNYVARTATGNAVQFREVGKYG